MELITNNIDLILSGIAIIAGLVAGGRYLRYYKIVAEVAFSVWAVVEKHGVDKNLKGGQKLSAFIETWRQAHMNKFGKAPTVKAEKVALAKATDLSVKDKIITASSPLFSAPVLGTLELGPHSEEK